MRRELALSHRIRGVDRVRRVREKIAADRKKYLDLLLEHRVQSLNRVISPLLWRIKVELLRQSIKERLWRPLPDSHCAVALHIRMPAYTNCPRARPPDIAAHKQQVHNHRDVIHSVALLRHAQA